MVRSILTIALVLFLGMGTVAFGVTTVYEDDFDNVVPGSVPIAQVGTYAGGNALVDSGFTLPPSFPNYLDSFRDGNEDYDGNLSAAGGVGTLVHAEVMMYSRDGYPNFGLTTDGNFVAPHVPANSGVIVVSGSPGGAIVYAVDPAGGLVATGLTHLMDTWQKWEIDYVVGSSSYDLTVGGASVTLGAGFMLDAAATQVAGVFSQTFSGTTHALLDDVLVTIPEPTALLLMSFGLLGLTCCGVRRRK